MFRECLELEDIDKVDPEYLELLRRVLTIQADCEIGGPHLYVKDILPSAPSRTDKLMVARTAAEEIDHFRKIARLAGEVGADVSFVLSWPNQKRYLEAFRGVITTWEDFAVFGFLIDRVGRYQLDEFFGCTYKPLERILPQIIRRKWDTSDTERAKQRSWRPAAAMRRNEFNARWTSGTLKLSTCLAAQIRPAMIVMFTGASSAEPMIKHGSNSSMR